MTPLDQLEVMHQQGLQHSPSSLMFSQPSLFFACGLKPYKSIHYLSSGCLALTGYTAQELLADHPAYFSLLVPEDVAKVLADIAEQLVHQPTYQVQYRIRDRFGEMKVVQEKGKGVFGPKGILEGLEGWITLIHESNSLEPDADSSANLSGDFCPAVLVDASALHQKQIFSGPSLHKLLPTGIIAVDPEGRQTYVNSAFCTMVGWSEAELLGQMPPFVYWPQEEQPRIFKALEMLKAGQPPPEGFELKFQHRNGNQFDVLLFCSPMGEAEHYLSGWLASVCNISALKKAELACQESEQRHQSLVSNLAGAVFRCVHNHDWSILYISEQIFEISGYPATDFIQSQVRNLGSIVHLADKAAVDQITDAQIAAHQPYVIEYRIRHVDGSIRWVQERGQGIYSQTGDQVLFVDGLIIDITEEKRAEAERRRAEAALQENEALFRAISEQLPDALFLMDLDDPEVPAKIIQVNHSAVEMYGYAVEELLGRSLQELDDSITARKTPERIKRLLDGESMVFEGTHCRKDGSTFPVEINACLINYQERPRILGIHRDISDRKTFENSLRERERYLATLVEIQQQLLDSGDISNSSLYEKILLPLGNSSAASRVYVFEQHQDIDGRTLLSQQAEWCAEGVPPEIDNPELQSLDFEYWFPGWLEILSQGEVISGNVADFSATEQTLLIPQGILSILILPLLIQGKFFGMIGFDNCREACPWQPSEVAFLQAAAAALSLALEQRQAQAALRDSEERFRHLVEAMSDWVWEVDQQGICTYASAQVENLLGYSRAEVIGKSPFEFMLSEEVPQTAAIFAEALATQQSFKGLQSTYCHKDGHLVFQTTSGVPIFDTHGQLRGYRGIGSDITARSRAEAALRRSEELYRSVVENTKEVIFQADLAGNWTFLNPAWTEITGFSITESLSTPLWQYVHPENRAQCLVLIEQLLSQQQSYCRHEARFVTQSGQVRWLAAFAQLHFDSDHQVKGIAGTLNDVTDLKQAEALLQASEQRLRRQNLALVALAKEQQRPKNNFRQALQKITEVAAQTLEVERVGVFLYTHDRQTMNCLNLYELSSDRHSQNINFSKENYPLYFQALESERTLDAHDALTDSRIAEFRESYLQPLGITSLLDAPIWQGGQMVGVVCHEQVGRQRHWTPDEQRFAASIADLIALALEAGDREQAEQQYRSIFENALEAIWQSTPDGRYLSANPRHAQMLGFNSPEEVIQHYSDLRHQLYVDPERRPEFVRLMETQGFVTDFEAECYRKDGSRFWSVENARAVYNSEGELLYYEGFSLETTARKQAEAELMRTNHQLRDTLESITSGFFSIDHNDVFTYVNRLAEPLLQRTREELLGQNIWQALPELQSGKFLHFYQQAVTQQGAVKFEEFYPSLNCWLEVHAYPSASGLSVYLHDISDRKRTEEALWETKERYALAIMGANDGIWDWNLLSNQIYFSPRWKAMLGYSESDLGNHPQDWFNLIHPQDAERVKLNLMLHQQGQTQHFEQEYRIQHKNGSYRWVLSRGIAVRDSEGIPYRMAGSLTDNTERQLAEQQLLHDALHDPLTGLPNRTLFMDRLGQVIRQARRRSDYRFAILFIDLDRFKVINDSLGHLAGDHLLIDLSERLLTCLRPDDTVARLGGDEFVILIDDLQGTQDATQVASRIKELLERPFSLNGQVVFTSASIGITLSTAQHTAPQDYLRNADIAMYQSKNAGGDRYTLFTDAMHTSAIARLQLETDLRRAVERQELRLQYQPILSLATEHVIGFEALVRWQHPTEGLIFPNKFISLAEETGLIIPIGKWVLEEACHQMQSWCSQIAVNYPLLISVNLSSKQLAQPDFISQIDRILAQTGLNPSWLKLEITESMILENTDAAQETLHQLKERQIQLSMDDFGTGYSSLNYLHRLPIDLLKIDRSFINEMDKSAESLELVKAIISIAHSLRMDVVAEGIETQDQLQQLQILGCEFGQGYLFSRPVDSRFATHFLKQSILEMNNLAG